MQLSRHAEKRIKQRGLDQNILAMIAFFLPDKLLKASRQTVLRKKDALRISRTLRHCADKIERHAGVQIILDSSGSKLITTYRKGE